MTTQGTDARSDKTACGLGPKGDGPVGGNADAPNLNRPTQGSGGGAEGKHGMLERMVDEQIEREGSMSSFMVRAGLLKELLASSTSSNTQGALEVAASDLRVWIGNRRATPFDLRALPDSHIDAIEAFVNLALAALKSGEAGLS